jgi:uncharacterized membrane protein
MQTTLILHITAGLLGLVSGAVALSAAKGGKLHRRSGMLFVAVMLPMCATGFLISTLRGVAPVMNVPAALLTAYLVLTAFTTVQPSSQRLRRWNALLAGVGFAVGVACIVLGGVAFASPGIPNGFGFPLFLFGTIGLLAARGDLKALRAAELRGPSRLRRHLWRMCFALFVAAGSFFLGQAQVFPKPVRIPGLLALPVLGVLAAMFFWLWRVGRGGARLDALQTSSQLRS